MPEEMDPFRIETPDADPENLRDRVNRTLGSDKDTVDRSGQGVPLQYAQPSHPRPPSRIRQQPGAGTETWGSAV
jgi:hypothetical protein